MSERIYAGFADGSVKVRDRLASSLDRMAAEEAPAEDDGGRWDDQGRY